MRDCLDGVIRGVVQKNYMDWCHAWNVTQSHGNAIAKAKAELLEVICEDSFHLTDTNPLVPKKQSLEFTAFNNRGPFRLYWLSGSARPKGSMVPSGSPALLCTDLIYTVDIFLYYVVFFIFFKVLGIEPRALFRLSKHSPSTELHPSPAANFYQWRFPWRRWNWFLVDENKPTTCQSLSIVIICGSHRKCSTQTDTKLH